jgi:hypothetical protein
VGDRNPGEADRAPVNQAQRSGTSIRHPLACDLSCSGAELLRDGEDGRTFDWVPVNPTLLHPFDGQ